LHLFHPNTPRTRYDSDKYDAQDNLLVRLWVLVDKLLMDAFQNYLIDILIAASGHSIHISLHDKSSLVRSSLHGIVPIYLTSPLLDNFLHAFGAGVLTLAFISVLPMRCSASEFA